MTCRACGVELEEPVSLWIQTPLGITCLKACPGVCESLAVQGYGEQPARLVTLRPTVQERLRAA